MKILFRLLIGLSALALLDGTIAFAKGPVDKITISAPGLAKPIEITQGELREQFNPWDGNFIDKSRGAIRPAPKTEAGYEVVFTTNNEQGQPTWVYTIRYYPAPSGEGGYIYLPGPGDPEFEKNIFTIISGFDGSWVYASKAWDAAARRVLSERGVSLSPTPLALPIAQIVAAPWFIALFVILLAMTLTLVIRLVRRAVVLG